MMKSNGNPWSVPNLDEFLKYCCPECDEKYETKEPFVMHAFEKHPKAKECLELRLDSENVSVVCKSHAEQSSSMPLKLEEVFVEDVVINVNNETHFEIVEENLNENLNEVVVENETKHLNEVVVVENEAKLKKSEFLQTSVNSEHNKQQIVEQGAQNNKCNQCGKSFGWASNLDLHMKNVHGLSYQSSNASSISTSEIFVKEEQVLPDDTEFEAPKIFACKFCKETFALFASMQTHILQNHANQTALQCEICDSSFENDDRKKQHIAVVHEGVKNHVCNKCGKAFGWISNLREHQTLVHGSGAKNHRCGICSKGFTKNSDRKRHEAMVHEAPKFPCDQCPKVLKDERKRKAHIDAVHKGLKKFKCNCGMAFAWESSRRYHWKVYTHHAAPIEANVDDPLEGEAKNDGDVQYPCDSCDLVFFDKNAMLDHCIDVHNPKPFACNICNAKYNREHALKRHIEEVHERNMKFDVCPICKKGFRKAEFIPLHIAAVHDGLKNFKCDQCDKSFKYPGTLRGHMKTIHQGKKPAAIPCDICDKLFASKKTLKEHVQFIHEKKPIAVCPHCNKGYGTRKGLEVHITVVHGKLPF